MNFFEFFELSGLSQNLAIFVEALGFYAEGMLQSQAPIHCLFFFIIFNIISNISRIYKNIFIFFVQLFIVINNQQFPMPSK